MSYVHRVSMLKCTHPAVATIWETGWASRDTGETGCAFHIVTIDNKRFDASYNNGQSEKAAIKKIEEWLDETYPELKGKHKPAV